MDAGMSTGIVVNRLLSAERQKPIPLIKPQPTPQNFCAHHTGVEKWLPG